MLQEASHPLSTRRERRDFFARDANENADWVLDAAVANSDNPVCACVHARVRCVSVCVYACVSESVLGGAHTSIIYTGLH